MVNIQESAKPILALLPGADCGGFGGCGYQSCSECAEAIAGGGSIAQCPACNQDVVSEIACIMDVEPVTVTDKVAFIKCNGNAAGKERFSNIGSCEEAKASGFAPGECQWGCVGIGSCVERCVYGAMSIKDGNITIDKERCNGCMACVSACPQSVIKMVPRDASNFIPCSSEAGEEETLKTCGYGCIGCKECENSCPEQAVKVINNVAVIDYDKCVGCVACTIKCEKKIIIDELHDLTKLKEEVAFVRCTGGAKGSAKLKALDLKNCEDAEAIDLESIGVCAYGCTGLGNCTKVCRFDAISVDYGVAFVNAKRCVGCGDCMRECPRNMIEMVPYKGVKQMACSSKAAPEIRMAVCDTGCIGCGDCADNCPNGAITMVSGNPWVDDSKCVNCGVCKYVCSRHVIAERKVPEYNYLQQDAIKLDNVSK